LLGLNFTAFDAKFSKAPDAFRAQRREGPHRVSEKRPRTFVSALQSIGASEYSKNRHLRDFWRRSIFDFFDSIDPLQTLTEFGSVGLFLSQIKKSDQVGFL
jgi:hypothetical protein